MPPDRNDPEESPQLGTTIRSQTNLLGLPVELIHGICEHLDFDSSKAFRLVCKEIQAKSVYSFGAKYLEAIRLIVTVQHLETLIEISKHPHFSEHVRCVNFVSQPVDPWPDESAFDQPSLVQRARAQQIDIFRRVLAEQHELKKYGQDVRMLMEAFENLANLQVIQLSYIFDINVEAEVSDPEKTDHFQRKWKSKDFYSKDQIQLRLLAPMGVHSSLFGTNTTNDLTMKPVGQKATGKRLEGELELYRMEEVIMKAIDSTGGQSIKIDLTVVAARHDNYSSCFRAWTSVPFSLSSLTWVKMESRLRSLALVGFDSERRWKWNLLCQNSLKAVEEFRFIGIRLHDGTWPDDDWEVPTLECYFLKHVEIANMTLPTWILVSLLTRSKETIKTINLRQVFLWGTPDDHTGWIAVLNVTRQMPRLSLVKLAGVQSDLRPQRDSFGCISPQSSLVLRDADTPRGLEMAITGLRHRTRAFEILNYSYDHHTGFSYHTATEKNYVQFEGEWKAFNDDSFADHWTHQFHRITMTDEEYHEHYGQTGL